MKLMSRAFLLLSITVLVVGCKIEVIVPSGGDVKSESSTKDCVGGSLCEHNVTDLTFNETFTAVARPGYVFTHWNKGHGFLCGDSVDPLCKVSLLGIPEGDTGVDALLASGHIFYVMPHFQFVGVDTDVDGILNHLDEDDDNDGVFDKNDKCPLNPVPECAPPDSIIVNGREWAQPDSFLNLSWDDINAVCPGGVCGSDAILNGWDVSGWTWASEADLCELFNWYLSISDLDVATCPVIEFLTDQPINEVFDAIFERDGWRAAPASPNITPFARVVWGWSSSYKEYNFGMRFGVQAVIVDSLIEDGLFNELNNQGTTLRYDRSLVGAWFYK